MWNSLSIWGKIIAGIVSVLNILATAMVTKRAKQDGRNEVELGAVKKANDVSDDIAAARESLRHDIEELQRDPNNRRKGDTL